MTSRGVLQVAISMRWNLNLNSDRNFKSKKEVRVMVFSELLIDEDKR